VGINLFGRDEFDHLMWIAPSWMLTDGAAADISLADATEDPVSSLLQQVRVDVASNILIPNAPPKPLLHLIL